MRYLTIFVDLENDEYAPLIQKYQSDVDLKFFLARQLKKIIAKELEDIKTDKALEVLSAEEKL